MNDFKEQYASNEMVLYPRFYRELVLRRVNQIATLWDLSRLTELPKGSILHLIDDNFLMTKPIVLVPDVNGWALSLRPERKYVMHVSQPVPQTMLPLEETFVLPPNGVQMTIMNFKKRNQRTMRPVNSVDAFPNENRINVQSVVSYDSLYRARIFGLLRNYRRFNYIMTNVLNGIAMFPVGRLHYIPIPVGDRVFDRNKFQLSFDKYTRSTIKLPEDPWYLFCMNFMGFLNVEKTPSMFEKIPEKYWPYINFILYTNSKFIILNLRTMKDLNVRNMLLWRTMKLLNLIAESGRAQAAVDYGDVAIVHDTKEDETELLVDADTPFDEQPQVEPVQPKEEPAPEPVKQSEPDKKEPVSEEPPVPVQPVVKEPVQTMFTKRTPRLVVTHEATKRKLEQALKEDEEFISIEPELMQIDPKWLEVDVKEGEQNVPKFTENMTVDEQEKAIQEMIDEIDDGANEKIEEAQNLTQQQVARAQRVSQVYKDITIGEQTVQEIIKNVPDDSVATNTLDFLENDPDITDKSMLKSSVATFETDYMKKMFKRDLVMNLASFNKQGMFLKTVNLTDVSDSLNQLMEVKATYEDIDKKVHTIRFKLPKVDDRGYCMVNGTLAVLKKQRVPLPICKLNSSTVALTSNYNKYLVVRNSTQAHSFTSYIEAILTKGNVDNAVSFVLNSRTWPSVTLPYEYTALAKKYNNIYLKKGDATVELYFNLDARYNWFMEDGGLLPADLETIKTYESDTKSIAFVRINKRQIGFIDVNNEVTILDLDEHITVKTTIIDLICNTLNVSVTPLSEWVDFKMLDTTVPVIFALCYKYGLSDLLNYTNVQYRVVNAGARTYRKWSDIVIKFADKTLIIPRTQPTVSLLFAGLNYYKLDKIMMEEMDSKDIYFDLMQSKKRSINFLKGIVDFFDLFVDPITREVLEQMKEPTTTKDLLIRATQLLTTEDHKPQSSSANFRFRSYERINSAVYNVMARSFAKYRNKNIGATSNWSIADYEIQQLIMQDQLKENVDLINPINDIKYQEEFSHAGFGGGRKSLDTFTVDDRQYPEDGVGVISEATVDSAKTGFAASTSMDPTMVNMRGMVVAENANELTPTQVLSISSLTMPGVTQDDAKRCNFLWSKYLEIFTCMIS